MIKGIVACPVHGDNETTKDCPDCRPYMNRMKPLPDSIVDNLVFCREAGKKVPIEEAPFDTTAWALCSFCGKSIHYPPHKFEFKKYNYETKSYE